jgi:hypothetical protein
MDFPRLRAIAARVVIASMPALAMGCGYQSGTRVVPIAYGQGCADACDANRGHAVRVTACTTALYLDETPDGTEVAVCRMDYRVVGGRRPAGLAPIERECADDVGAWLSEVARLEAASVPAFTHLARELEAHGAPRALIDDTLRAADDERRHARVMASWRDRYGAPVIDARVEPAPIRSLSQIAIDNAVEGCVGEMWGALVGLHQAHAAGDPSFRADIAQIAEDELSHAHLSLRVHEWMWPLISETDRARVTDAIERAIVHWEDGPEHGLAARETLGLPDRAASRAMIAHARAEGLWSA